MLNDIQVEVHVAFGASTPRPFRALGTFDMHKPNEALQLGYCLAMLRDHTSAVIQRARDLLPSALNGLPPHWRLDLAGRQHPDPDPQTLPDRIEVWPTAVAR